MGRGAILEKYRERVRVIMRKKGASIRRVDNFSIEASALAFTFKVDADGPKKEYLLEPFAALYAPFYAVREIRKIVSSG